MKPKILKLSSVILLFLFIGAGCQKDEIPYADESIEISVADIGIAIYKTQNEYLDKISVQYTDDNLINAIPSYTMDDKRVGKDKNGNFTLNTRWLLRSGYIVDTESYIHDIYTNITIREYVEWNEENNVAGWPGSIIEPRIIDKNPFIEFYYLDRKNQPIIKFTLGEINDMIINGTLETVFTKLK